MRYLNEVAFTVARLYLVLAILVLGYCEQAAGQVVDPYQHLVGSGEQGARFGWIPERINEHSVIERDSPKGSLPGIGSDGDRERQSLRWTYQGAFGQGVVDPYATLTETDTTEKKCTLKDCKAPKIIHDKGECQKNFCVMITASWCGVCQRQYPMILDLRGEKYIMYVFDVTKEEFKNYDAKFDVKTLPTYIVFENGREVTRTTGKTDIEWFRKNLKKIEDQEKPVVPTNPYDNL